MVRHVFLYVFRNLLLGPTPEAPIHFAGDLRVNFGVDADLVGVDLTANFGGFSLAADVGLILVCKLVVDSVVEVQIVELLVFPVDLPHSLPKLNRAPILQKQLYVIEISKLEIVKLLLFMDRIERAIYY